MKGEWKGATSQKNEKMAESIAADGIASSTGPTPETLLNDKIPRPMYVVLN